MGVFEIIRAEQRTADMVGWFAGVCGKVTDFIGGSVFRSKYEAVAVEMESQDFAFYSALKKAIPTAIYNAFDFTLQPANAAANYVIFTANTAPILDIVIPAGTIVTTAASTGSQNNSYATAEVAVLPAGQTAVSVFVECTIAGSAGNTDVNTVNTLQTVVPGVDQVNNPAAFTNGTDIETESSRRGRFLVFISTLARGTNAAVQYGALTAQLVDGSGNITESVAYAVCIDAASDLPAGSGTCYICNSAGTASTGLIALAQKIINGYTDASGNKIAGWKAAGAIITVAAATLSAHNTTVAITMSAGVGSPTTLATQAQSITSAYLSSGGIGDPYIFNEHVQRVMNLPGVEDVAISPTGNVTPSASTILRPGSITVTTA